MVTEIGKAFEQKLKEVQIQSIQDWIKERSKPTAMDLPGLFNATSVAPPGVRSLQAKNDIIQTIQAYPCLEIVFRYLPMSDREKLVHKIIQLPIPNGLALLSNPKNLPNSPALPFFIAVNAAQKETKQAVIQWLQSFSPKQRNELLQGIRLFDIFIFLSHSTLTTCLLQFFSELELQEVQSIFTTQALANESNLAIFLAQIQQAESLIIQVLQSFIECLTPKELPKLISIIEHSTNHIAWHLALQEKKSRPLFREVLRKRMDQTAQQLLQGLAILELIENPSLSSEILQTSTESGRAALKLPWLHKQTLLHMATQQRHHTIIAWLLKQGLDPNIPDTNQQSAWQIALQHNQKDILCDFAHDLRITLHNQDQQTPSPLQQCINQHYFPLTQALSVSITKRIQEPDVIEAVRQTLVTYTPQSLTHRQIHALNDILSDAGTDIDAPQSFRESLSQYSTQEQDPLCCFILMVTTIHQLFPASHLEQAVYDFLRRQCEVLANAPHDQRERKTAQMVIIFYLFALPHTFSQCIIKTLRAALTSEQQKHFDTLLCYALAQPRIYRAFDITMHHHFHAQLPAGSPALKTLFEIYLLNKELYLLPAVLLLEIANTYNNTQLINLLNQRRSGVIAVLVDNSLDYQQPISAQTLTIIQQTIQSQIKLFNTARPAKPLADLQIMLALAQTSSSKHLLKSSIQLHSETTLFLHQHIRTILQSINPTNPIPIGSLLYDLAIANLEETLKAGYPTQADQICIRLFNQLNTNDASQLIISTKDKLTALNPFWAKAICNSAQADALILLWFEQQCAQQTFVTLTDFLPHFLFLETHLQIKTVKRLCEHVDHSLSIIIGSSLTPALIALRLFLIILEHPKAQRREQLGRMFSFLKRQTITLTVTDLSLWIKTFQDSLMDSCQPVADRRLALQLLTHVLGKQTHEQHLEWVKTCPAVWQEGLFSHVIAGLHDTHFYYAQACERLTQLYGQYFFFLAEPIQTIVQRYMGQQDLSFLSNSQLQHIATQVLQTAGDLEAYTYQGVWIQRLLTAPQFIAACAGTDTIDRLVARYQRLSHILKQDELTHLTQYIIHMPHAKEHRLALQNLADPRYAEPEFQAALLAKRDRLMQFVVKDAIRGLFNQLEDACLEMRQHGNTEEIAIAHRALQVFYTYHGEKIASLRSDFLFRIADRLYGYAIAPHGDLVIANNPLLHWLNKHLPHRSFQIEELERRLEVQLYDHEGQSIGYIDEYNQALTFIDHEPTPLINAPGIMEGMDLYDSQQRKIGTLAADGQVMSDNLFRNATIAMIVGQLPQNTLALSPAALDLLIRDVLHHNTLDLVYTCETMQNDAGKRQWFDQKLTQYIAQSRQLLTPAIMDSLTLHQTPAQLTYLLTHIKQSENLLTLFKSMLTHDGTRHGLFNTHFDTFITHSNVDAFLTLYLSFYKELWFAQGLQCFVQCSRPKISARLFQKSLFQYYLDLKQNGEKKAQAEMHQILRSFLSNNTIAECLIAILAIDTNVDVQTLAAQHIFPIVSYFEKNHLIPALQLLNQSTPTMELRSLYQLILLILEHNFEQLFAHEEPRYSTDMVWQISELDLLSKFVSMHQQANFPFDRQNQLANKLLDVMLLRCANFGYGQFFYTSANQLQEARLLLPIQPAHLRSNAARSFSIKQSQKSPAENKIWQELRAQQGTIDWQQMLLNTWQPIAATDQQSLPAITVFLMHYVGPTAQVQRLLRDSLKNPTLLNDKQALHSLTHIMVRFPQRDISKLIFSECIFSIQKNPPLMDATIWQHLNDYYHQHHPLPAGARSFSKEFSLLQYFAQKKAYQVVQHAYRIQQTTQATLEPNTKAWQKFFLASQIEQRLQKHLKRWYFPLLAFFLRLRHNTFALLQKGVQRCERPIVWPEPKLPKTIKSDVSGGAIIAHQIQIRPMTQNLKKRYELFLENETKRKLKRGITQASTVSPDVIEEQQTVGLII